MKNYTYYGSHDPKTTIIYIHGGAYVMGDRFDLPETLQSLLIEGDRALITIDYPLAPQVSVDEIIETVTHHINSLIKKYEITSLMLMGRSAGANIVLSIDPNLLIIPVKGLISFYGYSSTDLLWMNDPIRNLDMPLQQQLVHSVNTQDFVSYSRSIHSTYGYYYTLRKLGVWQETVGLKHKEILWPNNIRIFIAHSIFDPDVPFRCSLSLKNYFNHCTTYTSNSKKHAFDHDLNEQSDLFETLNLFLDSF